MIRKDERAALIRVASSLSPRDATRRAILSAITVKTLSFTKVKRNFDYKDLAFDVSSDWDSDDMALIADYVASKFNPGSEDPDDIEGEMDITVQKDRSGKYSIQFNAKDAMMMSWTHETKLVRPVRWCAIEIPGLDRISDKMTFVEVWAGKYFKSFNNFKISDEGRVYLTNAVPKKPVPGLASATVYPEDLTNVPERVLKNISFYFLTR